jgi:hypothetical protein
LEETLSIKEVLMTESMPPGEDHESIEVITYSEQTHQPRVGTLRMLMRMALGGAVLGREELKNRFQEKQNQTPIPGAELNRVTPIESEADRARYAAVGAIANSSDALKKGISRIGKRSDRTFGTFVRALQPVTDSRLLRPFRRQYRKYLDHGDKVVSNWVAAGRREEYLGRQLAQETAVETIEETLDYLAESPEMDELMAQQSMDLVDDILFDDIRAGASNSSLILTNWFNTVILRRKSQMQADSPSDAGEEPTVNE